MCIRDRDVTDCATILEAIASYDTKDSTSVKREDYDFTRALVDDVAGMKIGMPRDYLDVYQRQTQISA